LASDDQTQQFLPGEPGPEAHAAAESAVPLEWHPGDTILDLYEVKQVFTSGGMGLVYHVHHCAWDLDLAVKCPRPEYFRTETQKQNFIREAETWLDLGLHPHIVTCHYVRTLGGIPRLFAEFVAGGSLKDWTHDRRLYAGGPEQALERILDVAIQFAWGLAYAHEQGLVHQDVKPANVLMTPDGVAKVTGFGLAKARAAAGEQPEAGGGQSILVSSGGYTPAYCSPEQAARQPVSLKTDIWSWAVSALEMFTSEVTWLAGQVAAEALDAYLEMGPPNAALPSMPPALADLLRQCLRQQPADRPASMAEVADQLLGIYVAETGRAYPRQQPKAVELRADSLNNKALSLWDLGKQVEAENAWTQALTIEPHHPLSTYNLGLIQWRSSRMTDDILLRNLREALASHTGDWLPLYLLLLVHLERDDCISAFLILKNLSQDMLHQAEFASVYQKVTDRGRRSGGLLEEYSGHYGGLTCVAVSLDGKRVLTGSRDAKVKLWNTESDECIRTLEGSDAYINSVSISGDGHLALSGCDSNRSSARCWDLESGNVIHTFGRYTSWVSNLCLSQDGKYALTGGASYSYSSPQDAKLVLWEAVDGKKLCDLNGHTATIIFTSFSQDNRYAYSGSQDNQLRIWEVPGGKCIQVCQGPALGETSSMSLSADGKVALSGCKEGTAVLWEVDTGRCIRVFQGHTGAVLSVWLTKDGGHAFSSSRDYSIRRWEVTTGRCLRTYERHIGDVNAICLSSDERILFSAGADKALVRWQVGFDTPIEPAPFMLARIIAGETVSANQTVFVNALEQARQAMVRDDFSNALRHLRTVRSLPGFEHATEALLLWRKLYHRFARKELRESREIASFQATVTAACLNADGSFILGGASEGHLMILAHPAGNILQQWQGHAGKVTSITVSEDGQYALSGGLDCLAKYWDLSSGQCLQTFSGHEEGVTCAALSVDRRFALTGSFDHSIRLWEVLSGKCLRSIELTQDRYTWIDSAALNASGDLALCRWGGWLDLWDLSEPENLRRMVGYYEDHEENAEAPVRFSAAGKYAVTCGERGSLKRWDLATGQCTSTFEGHLEPVDALWLSADERYVLSGSQDNTVKLWEIASGRCLRTFEGHRTPICSVSMSKDGFYVLSGSQDGVFKVWELDWELDEGTSEWNESVRPWLENFLSTQCNIGADQVSRTGEPGWTEQEFEELLMDLGYRGYGCLNPKIVQRELEKIVQHRKKIPELFHQALATADEAINRREFLVAARWVEHARQLEGHEQNDQAMQAWTQLYAILPKKKLRNAWVIRTFNTCFDATISPDGCHALSLEEPAVLRLWDTGSGECLQTMETKEREIHALCFSPDGKTALVAGRGLRLWDLKNGQCLQTMHHDQFDEVYSTCFSPDGQFVLSGHRDNTLRMWDVASGRCLRISRGHQGWVIALSFSPDGQYFVSGSTDKIINIWETASGRWLRTIEGSQGWVKSVQVSSDGRFVLSSSWDLYIPPNLSLWDARSGQCLKTFPGRRESIERVYLSREGRFALSTGAGELTAWDLKAGQSMYILGGNEGRLKSDCLSADGCFALSGGYRQVLKLWQLDWELEEKDPAGWDEGARPHLKTFLTLHTPYAAQLLGDRKPTEEEITLALSRQGKPIWVEKDFQGLLHTLGCVGYGWLRPEGVRRKLEEMARER